jgi:Conjugal transfer protein TraD
MNYRKAHTRTKIQLGGLVVKAGLLDPLKLHLGEDLQKDEQNFDAVATLMGAFLDLADPLQNDTAQKRKEEKKHWGTCDKREAHIMCRLPVFKLPSKA